MRRRLGKTSGRVFQIRRKRRVRTVRHRSLFVFLQRQGLRCLLGLGVRFWRRMREGELKIEEDSHSSGDWPMTENSEKILAEEKGSRTS